MRYPSDGSGYIVWRTGLGGGGTGAAVSQCWQCVVMLTVIAYTSDAKSIGAYGLRLSIFSLRLFM